MKHKKLIIISSIIIFSIVLYFSLSYFVKTINRTTATVAKVIDGDTVELANGKKIRLLGIDAPEKGQYYYIEAKNELKRLIEGKKVFLEKDRTNKDGIGRLLRYVFVDDVFINAELVRNGFANAYIVEPDNKYADEILAVEKEAREKGIGIWKQTYSPYSDCIEVLIHYDAKGNDNENLNDEYVIFKNICNFTINITNWTVKDSSTNLYVFQNFSLAPKSTVKLFSGSGEDIETELYWNNEKAIWNNDVDILYLRDSENNLILVRSYGS